MNEYKSYMGRHKNVWGLGFLKDFHWFWTYFSCILGSHNRTGFIYEYESLLNLPMMMMIMMMMIDGGGGGGGVVVVMMMMKMVCDVLTSM